MKNMIKLFGIIAIVAIIGLSMVSCDSDPDPGTKVTITGIPSQYNGKFAMLMVGFTDPFEAYGMLTISGTSATFELLDWDNDAPILVRNGNYPVSIIIADSMQAIVDDNEMYVGIILSKAFSGDTVSIGFNEFISAP